MVRFLSTMVVLPPSQIPPSTAEQEANANIALARMSPPPAYTPSPTSPTAASPSSPTVASPTHLRPASLVRPASTVNPPPSPPPPPLPPTPVLNSSPLNTTTTSTPRNSIPPGPTIPEPALLHHEAYPDAVPIDEPLPAYSRYPKRSNSTVSEADLEGADGASDRRRKRRGPRRILGIKMGPMMSCLVIAGVTVLVAALVAGIMQAILKRQIQNSAENDDDNGPQRPAEGSDTVDVVVPLSGGGEGIDGWYEGRPTGTDGGGVAEPTPTSWVRMA